MFESAEIGQKVDRADYEREVPRLREALLDAQFELHRHRGFAVAVVLAGVSGGGRSEVANLLNAWMDPRHLSTHAFGRRNDLERERPYAWRYWQALPPKGRIGILLGAWYHELLIVRTAGRIDAVDMQRALQDIRYHEKMLADEDVLLVKLWLHLSRDEQRKRIKELMDNRHTRWRVGPADLVQVKNYNRYRDVSEQALRETSTGEAPWTVVEATDPRFRDVTVGRVLLEAIRGRIANPPRRAPGPVLVPAPAAADNLKLLRGLDLTRAIARKDYLRQLEKHQERLALLTRRKKFARRSMVVVFEGHDAAGKGSSIRRITEALDARQYTAVPIGAPTEEERSYPSQWRFWRHLPGHGQITIFDRSWYGRVLVERVEGLCADSDWMRAYREINHFEEQLLRNGTIVVKFWLQISKDEQLRRLQERESTGFKHLGAEGWGSRKRWAGYEAAVADMIGRTSTEIAPWTIVEAEDKHYARVKILRTLVRTLGEAL